MEWLEEFGLVLVELDEGKGYGLCAREPLTREKEPHCVVSTQLGIASSR